MSGVPRMTMAVLKGLAVEEGCMLEIELAAKTAECERLREDAERFSREADNLARMLRRGQWLAKKETGDTGLKVWAGQAYDLLDKYGRLGSPLRGEDAAIDAARKETP